MTPAHHDITTRSNDRAIDAASHTTETITETTEPSTPTTDNRTTGPSLTTSDSTRLERLKNWHPPMRYPPWPGCRDTARAVGGAVPC